MLRLLLLSTEIHLTQTQEASVTHRDCLVRVLIVQLLQMLMHQILSLWILAYPGKTAALGKVIQSVRSVKSMEKALLFVRVTATDTFTWSASV